jgi:hypothetical protein
MYQVLEATLALAVTSIWLLDFAINAVQAMDRALITDVIPAEQQNEVNVWAGRMRVVRFGSTCTSSTASAGTVWAPWWLSI